MDQTRLRLIFSIGALLVAMIHLIWPSLAIDAITAVFVGLAVLPWIAPLVKSVEVHGLKIDLRPPLQEPSEVATRVGKGIRSQMEGTRVASTSQSEPTSLEGRDESQFNAGVQAGVRAVATVLEDLTVVVRVDDQEHRRELGKELSRKLSAAADVLPRWLSKSDDSR